mmetsp:Transcript_11738/g.13201  ORF Transcript_11738/g.13201 Transcript_11738/m.13201 type:complete len:219 (-) Transcript_11738:162-818(-)
MVSFRSRRNRNRNRSSRSILTSSISSSYSLSLSSSSSTTKNKNKNKNRNKNIYEDDDSYISTYASTSSIITKSEEETETETETVIQTKKNKKKKKGTVQFSTVHIREHNFCLGDNPAVSRGPPISLDWYYTRNEEMLYDIDDYEQELQQLGRQGVTSCICIPSNDRVHLLRQIGYSRKELREATCRVEKSKNQRLQTKKRLQQMDKIRSFFFRSQRQK